MGTIRAEREHLAEDCRDDDCPRYGCRMYRKGYQAGYRQGWADRPPEIIIITVPAGSG